MNNIYFILEIVTYDCKQSYIISYAFMRSHHKWYGHHNLYEFHDLLFLMFPNKKKKRIYHFYVFKYDFCCLKTDIRTLLRG